METVIDYTEILNTINNQLTDFEPLLLRQNEIAEQTAYLIMFLFGALVAVSLVSILKGLK